MVTPSWGVSFLLSPLTIIDLLAAFPLGLRIALMASSSQEITGAAILLCAVAFVRLLKIIRRFQKFHLLLKAFQLAFEALPVLMFVLCMITLFFASAVYLVEPRDNIKTLPMAIYFTLVTITSL